LGNINTGVFIMSRSGEEMMLELATILGTMQKTAAKKDEDDKKEDKKEEKEDKKEEDDEDKEDKKEEDDKKEDKKASVMMGVVSSLVKLANELDEVGAEEASSLVDEALQVIVKNLEKPAE